MRIRKITDNAKGLKINLYSKIKNNPEGRSNLYLSTLTYLILLILILILIMIKNNNFTSYGCMMIVMHNRSFEKNLGFTLEEFLADKKEINIQLTGNELIDAELLEKFQSEVRNLVRSENSIHSIHIKFCKASKYFEFTKVIEICYVENARIFVPFGYDFWVTNPARKDFIMKHPPTIPN